MGRKVCALCRSKDENKSLHSFPKDEHLCSQWKKACGFLEKDNVSNVFLCSIHFKFENLVKSNSTKKSYKRRLKSDAIPSQNISGSKKSRVCECKENSHGTDLKVNISKAENIRAGASTSNQEPLHEEISLELKTPKKCVTSDQITGFEEEPKGIFFMLYLF